MTQKSWEKAPWKEIGQYFERTQKQNQPPKQTNLCARLKRGRKRNCYFQMVSWMFKNPQRTHSVRMSSQSPHLWEERMSTARNFKCQNEAEQGLSWRNKEDRKREASLWSFLTQGWNLAFWVWKIIVSEHCLLHLVIGLQNCGLGKVWK